MIIRLTPEYPSFVVSVVPNHLGKETNLVSYLGNYDRTF